MKDVVGTDGCRCQTDEDDLCAPPNYCYRDKNGALACGQQRKNFDNNMPAIAQINSLIVSHFDHRNLYLMTVSAQQLDFFFLIGCFFTFGLA